MTYILGLTGSIGMGKSTTAGMFARRGIPVWDADDAVHRLYLSGAKGTKAIGAIYPELVTPDGVDRAALKAKIIVDDGLLSEIEAIIHPLVRSDRREFIERNQDKAVIVLDIPLLFESGYEDQIHGIAVVSTDPERQRQRVLSRPDMTEEHFEMISARQMPDAEKRARADWVIPTDNLEVAEAAVDAVLTEIGARHA